MNNVRCGTLKKLESLLQQIFIYIVIHMLIPEACKADKDVDHTMSTALCYQPLRIETI
jgi:hypothetical protein